MKEIFTHRMVSRFEYSDSTGIFVMVFYERPDLSLYQIVNVVFYDLRDKISIKSEGIMEQLATMSPLKRYSFSCKVEMLEQKTEEQEQIEFLIDRLDEL